MDQKISVDVSEGFFSLATGVVATASLPAAATAENGRIIIEDNGVVVLKILSRAKIDSISKGVMIVSGFDEVSSNKFKKVLIPFHRAQYKVGT